MRDDIDPKMIQEFNRKIREFTCAFCDIKTGGYVVASHLDAGIEWLICINCKRGSVINDINVSPHPLLGRSILGLPEIIDIVFTEARQSLSTNSYTACELTCRKLLMNVAVDKGAKENQSFIFYIDFLEDNGYITPPMKSWVNKIRENGNESTHEIKAPNQKRANDTLEFTTQLLLIIYESDYYANIAKKN